jgi:hypothetical protein
LLAPADAVVFRVRDVDMDGIAGAPSSVVHWTSSARLAARDRSSFIATKTGAIVEERSQMRTRFDWYAACCVRPV